MGNVADDLEVVLGARRKLIGTVADRDKEIVRLQEKLKEAEGWWIRLEQKVKVLERENPSILDAWDEEYLFDTRANVNFGRRANGDRRVSIKTIGMPKIIMRGAQVPKGESILRAAINRANGRTRSS